MELSKTAQGFVDSAKENHRGRVCIQSGYYPHLSTVFKPSSGKFGGAHMRVMQSLVKKGIFKLVDTDSDVFYIGGGKTCHCTDYVYELISKKS